MVFFSAVKFSALAFAVEGQSTTTSTTTSPPSRAGRSLFFLWGLLNLKRSDKPKTACPDHSNDQYACEQAGCTFSHGQFVQQHLLTKIEGKTPSKCEWKPHNCTYDYECKKEHADDAPFLCHNNGCSCFKKDSAFTSQLGAETLLIQKPVDGPRRCQDLCQQDDRCEFWTYFPAKNDKDPRCKLQRQLKENGVRKRVIRRHRRGKVSGPRDCGLVLNPCDRCTGMTYCADVIKGRAVCKSRVALAR